MCGELTRIATEHGPALRRRGLLSGAAAGFGLATSFAPRTEAAAATAGPWSRPKERTRLTLLGTGGGPVFASDGRAGTSTAITFGNDVYIVDLGHGSPGRLVEAGLDGGGTQGALMRVRAILFTHMHSDHITEWPAVYMTSPTNTESGKRTGDPIHVRGPGDRETLPRVFPPDRPTPAVVNPANPTPGVRQMTAYLRQAFANDFNDRLRDNNFVDPDSVFDIQDIDISRYWSVTESGIPPLLPARTRIPVLQNGSVTITATLVDHRPTAPTFGFRFDTPDGSIVVSGDTCPSENLINLAQECDYLVHEVIDEKWVGEFVAALPPEVAGPLKEHLLASHTTISQVGEVARRAGAKNLVLNHIVPTDAPARRFNRIRGSFGGGVYVGEDLMSFGIKR